MPHTIPRTKPLASPHNTVPLHAVLVTPARLSTALYIQAAPFSAWYVTCHLVLTCCHTVSRQRATCHLLLRTCPRHTMSPDSVTRPITQCSHSVTRSSSQSAHQRYVLGAVPYRNVQLSSCQRVSGTRLRAWSVLLWADTEVVTDLPNWLFLLLIFLYF